MAEMSDRDFARMFRMNRSGFKKLLERIEQDISVDEAQAKRSSGSAISKVPRLAATLRWMAGGSYLDICATFGLDTCNFFSDHYVLWDTMRALNKNLKLGFAVDPTYLETTAAEFSNLVGGVMKGCVSAFDGLVCRTRKPTKKEAGMSVLAHRNRKNCWALIVLAGCDARCRLIHLQHTILVAPMM